MDTRRIPLKNNSSHNSQMSFLYLLYIKERRRRRRRWLVVVAEERRRIIHILSYYCYIKALFITGNKNSLDNFASIDSIDTGTSNRNENETQVLLMWKKELYLNVFSRLLQVQYILQIEHLSPVRI
jgi:hypothetical protein